MTSEKIKTAKSLIEIEDLTTEQERVLFLVYKSEVKQEEDEIPMIDLNIQKYVRLDSLPENLKAQVNGFLKLK